MSTGQLLLHAGGRKATRHEVMTIEAPPATSTWFPVCHAQVLTTVERLLDAAGYDIVGEQFGLARGGNRFFGVIDLASEIAPGVNMTLGLRNSLDKSFPYGLAGGSRTFVCDNLALTGDWDELTISRKHTRNGERRFAEALGNGISKLAQYRDLESRRIERMRSTEISDTDAYALFMRAFESELLSHRAIRPALEQWNNPSCDWGEATLWRLYNAMNFPLQRKAISNPQAFSYQSMKLMELVCPLGHDGAALMPPADDRAVIDVTRHEFID